MKYLDPKNDLTFKKIFGQHKHLCISLLNSLLPLDEGKEIVEIEYLTSEMVPEILSQRNSIVDVQCVDKQGRIFIVEMQMYWTNSFMQRVLFNASKAYIKQLKKGEEYDLLKPVYVLSFVNQTFEKDLDAYYHHFKVVNVQNSDKTIEGLEFVFVEITKFKAKNITEKKIQVLWLMFLAATERYSKEILEMLLDNKDTREALQYLEESSYTEDELLVYDKYWDSISVEKTRLSDAHNSGIKKGKIEGKIETANQLKTLGVAIDIIVQATGLSQQEIENI